jgi:hypothetical protein
VRRSFEGGLPDEIRFESIFFTLTFVVAHSGALYAQIAGGGTAVGRENLCVTEGAVDKAPKNRLAVNATKMRAYVSAPASPAIQAHFTYLGPTAEESKLGSGASRVQFGLKLHAQDACNLVYAMWRIEPESKIVVSVKRNPGQTRSSECGNRGYQNVKPRRVEAAPALRAGDTHTLAAKIVGDELYVFVDSTEVWDGSLGPDAQGLQGPVGIRSDNARLLLDLTVGAAAGTRPDHPLACKSGPDASD